MSANYEWWGSLEIVDAAQAIQHPIILYQDAAQTMTYSAGLPGPPGQPLLPIMLCECDNAMMAFRC
jgi:hypothetical protein